MKQINSTTVSALRFLSTELSQPDQKSSEQAANVVGPLSSLSPSDHDDEGCADKQRCRVGSVGV